MKDNISLQETIQLTDKSQIRFDYIDSVDGGNRLVLHSVEISKRIPGLDEKSRKSYVSLDLDMVQALVSVLNKKMPDPNRVNPNFWHDFCDKAVSEAVYPEVKTL